MSFAPGIRLELRQQQSLVLTPQLQQAIRLLQMSNLELAGVIDQEVAENPFLQRSDREARAGAPAAARRRRSRSRRRRRRSRWRPTVGGPPPRSAPPTAPSSLKRPAGRAFDDERRPFEERLTRAKGLREHLGEQVLAMLHEPAGAGGGADAGRERRRRRLSARGRRDAGRALPDELEVVQAVRAAIQRCEPTGVGARDLGECLALQLAERTGSTRPWRRWWPTCRCWPGPTSPS